MDIIFDEDLNLNNIPMAKMMTAADFIMERENLPKDRTNVSFSFVSREEIQALNAEYRDMDRVTDVLSFPLYGSEYDIKEAVRESNLNSPEVAGGIIRMSVSLGDVVICREKAVEQAKEYGHSLERELIYLFVHSMFHLLGYDHMNDEEKKKMRAGEDEIMERLGVLR